jgi:hypothetical protein
MMMENGEAPASPFSFAATPGDERAWLFQSLSDVSAENVVQRTQQNVAFSVGADRDSQMLIDSRGLEVAHEDFLFP